MCAVFMLCGIGKIGKRDWTRTNDPHHVKDGNTSIRGIKWNDFQR